MFFSEKERKQNIQLEYFSSCQQQRYDVQKQTFKLEDIALK